jgi:hypothetical protein
MAVMKILGISLIFLILVGGCVTNSPSEQKKSDDDLYLQSLDDFVVLSNSPHQQQSTQQFSQEQMDVTDLQIRSTIFYNRVLPLKVSPNLEYSKTSFLQFLQTSKGMADFLLSHSSEERMRFATIPSSYTAEQKQEYVDFEQNSQKFGLFLTKTFDSNVCSAAEGKNSNVTKMCKEFATGNK